MKTNNSHSDWRLTEDDVTQGSMLEPIIFNIFLCVMFILVDEKDATNCAGINSHTAHWEILHK